MYSGQLITLYLISQIDDFVAAVFLAHLLQDAQLPLEGNAAGLQVAAHGYEWRMWESWGNCARWLDGDGRLRLAMAAEQACLNTGCIGSQDGEHLGSQDGEHL